MEYEKGNEIRFKDLSVPLKIVVCYSWVLLSLTILLVGFEVLLGTI